MVQKHRQVLIKIYPHLDLLIMVSTFFAAALAVAHAESDIRFYEFISMRIKIQNFVLQIPDDGSRCRSKTGYA